MHHNKTWQRKEINNAMNFLYLNIIEKLSFMKSKQFVLRVIPCLCELNFDMGWLWIQHSILVTMKSIHGDAMLSWQCINL